QAAQARVPAADPRGDRLLPREIRSAGALRLRISPGRCGALLRRADGEGLPISGVGALPAGPDRRLGAPGELPPDRPRDPIRHRADAGAPDHLGAARLLARQRAAGRVGLTLAGDGLRPGTGAGAKSGPIPRWPPEPVG